MSHRQFRHESINASPRMPAERFIGWTVHYLVGIAFAALLIGFEGESWIQSPTLGPALLVGIGTVAAPFLIMQPGMGAGIAACRTKAPNSARVQSVVSHAVFGLGLYISGWAVQCLKSCLTTWPIAFPTVAIVAPMVRRIVGRLTA